MKKFAFTLLTLAACSQSAPPAPEPVACPTAVATAASTCPAPKYEVHFSPHGGCSAAVVADVNSASQYIHVQTYSFTSQPITDALIAARKRGVLVEVLADKSDGLGSSVSKLVQLRAGGVSVFIDGKHAIAHNKVIVVDGKSVETGSYNYTGQAETSNAENCLVIADAPLAAAYEANWQNHKAHSTPF
jgi:phosphatidylserine/phosphatidylglycerophosphate/cardiolipin synthase-like enzyme